MKEGKNASVDVNPGIVKNNSKFRLCIMEALWFKRKKRVGDR